MRLSKTTQKILVLGAIGTLSLTGLTACGGNSKDAAGQAIDPSMPKVTGNEFGKKPKIAAGEKGKEPQKLLKSTLIQGKGKECRADQAVLADYLGQLWDGTEFDSSYKRGEPISFGLNAVIKGWTQGLTGVKEGSRVELVIPSELGYGDQGQPPKIPAKATLVFVVDVHKCFPQPSIKKEYAKGETAADPAPETPGISVKNALEEKPEVTVDWNKFFASKKDQKDPVLLTSGSGPAITKNDQVALLMTQVSQKGSQSQWDQKEMLQWIPVDQLPFKLEGIKAGSRLIAYLQEKAPKDPKAPPVPGDPNAGNPALVGIFDIVDVLPNGNPKAAKTAATKK